MQVRDAAGDDGVQLKKFTVHADLANFLAVSLPLRQAPGDDLKTALRNVQWLHLTVRRGPHVCMCLRTAQPAPLTLALDRLAECAGRGDQR